MTTLAFDFGQNWQAFSEAKLDRRRLDAAIQSLIDLIGLENIQGKTFLDIGCGSGLFSIAAAHCGARQIVAFDVNPTSVAVSQRNWERLRPEAAGIPQPHFTIGNILDEDFVTALGTFDIVYAWGVLHHTGSMWQAIEKATSLVNPQNGVFVTAIYNRHWTSPIWKQIKRFYNLAPAPVQRIANYLFGALIYVGVWVTARENPLHKERGMDFWYDVIDWLGGYPYEYATIDEVIQFVEPMGFQITKITRPRGWTGCNEFVFQRG